MVSSALLRRVALVKTDVSEEPRFLQEPHGVTTHKIPFFIVTAVKTSNFTTLDFVYRSAFQMPELFSIYIPASPAGLRIIFYRLNFETPTTWRAIFRYLFPPPNEQFSCTPRHWMIDSKHSYITFIVDSSDPRN
jgi:hypothetical protein